MSFLSQDIFGCVCVNPGRLTKGQVGGTFGRLYLRRQPKAMDGGGRQGLSVAAQVVRIWVLSLVAWPHKHQEPRYGSLVAKLLEYLTRIWPQGQDCRAGPSSHGFPLSLTPMQRGSDLNYALLLSCFMR